jgi:PPK2 family polyphosphate:nucleotide phosphotransferase
MRDDLDMAQPRVSERLRVGPGPVDLAAIDPRGIPGLPRMASADSKRWSREQLQILGGELFTQQEKLFAAAKAGHAQQRVLLVLQAMDCGGKDGTIKRVVGRFNPQGVRIVGFGKPTPEERSHDFLWRVERALPTPGVIGVFNRSHYEDVLVARVHRLVPTRTWRARYDRINRFEEKIVASGCAVVKVMLHISYAEQRRRLLARLDDPTKHWKYNPGDVDERANWPAYQEAYGEALSRCSSEAAPWHVVPADRKWYRDWAVAMLLREKLDTLKLAYPQADFDPVAERERLLAQDKVNSR